MANEQTTAVARRLDPNTPAGFRQQLHQNADKVTLPQGISIEAFENVVFSATVQNPDLLKADRQSLLLACLKAAQDGLLPNGRDAALVTFNTSVKEDGKWVSKKLVQYMPMVAGLRSKIWRAVNPKDGTPVVSSLKVNVVYKVENDNGYFVWEPGSVPEIQHRPMLEITEEEAADENIVCAYSIAKFADGGESVEVMRRFEIDKVRQCSQTGAVGKVGKFGDMKGKEIQPKGPWVDWFAEMAKKTVLRRHSKVLPMAGDIVSFEANDEASDFKAADNTASLLAVEPDAPQIENRSDEDEGGLPEHDPETGELIEEKAETDKPRRGRPPKAKEGDELGNASPASTGPHATAASTTIETATRSDVSDPSTDAGQANEAERDEIGVTKSPAEALADKLLMSFGRAETVIDLETHKRDLDRQRSALEPEHLVLLDAAYETRSAKLYGAPVPA